MAQTGYTPIQLYRSSTAAAVPSAGDLADGELALNTTDEKLYIKNTGGTVKLLASTAGSTGDVVGPSSATDGALAAFDGTTGKLIKQASTVTVAQGGTGSTTLAANNVILGNGTSAVQTVAPGASGNVLTSDGTTWQSAAPAVTLSGAETLTNKRIDPRVVSAASASLLTPSIATADQYAYTALAANLTINAPTGTPVDGNKLIFRILDNGTSRTLTWNATYTAIGVTLPTATTAGKMTYVGCIYNAANSRWDVIAVTTQA